MRSPSTFNTVHIFAHTHNTLSYSHRKLLRPHNRGSVVSLRSQGPCPGASRTMRRYGRCSSSAKYGRSVTDKKKGKHHHLTRCHTAGKLRPNYIPRKCVTHPFGKHSNAPSLVAKLGSQRQREQAAPRPSLPRVQEHPPSTPTARFLDPSPASPPALRRGLAPSGAYAALCLRGTGISC